MDARHDKDSENVKKQALLNLMKGIPLQTLCIAYVYAKNYMEYGEDVTKTWNTVVEQSKALEKAYAKGYYDALQRQTETIIEADAIKREKIDKAIEEIKDNKSEIACLFDDDWDKGIEAILEILNKHRK